MKLICTLFFAFIVIYSSAQETVKVTTGSKKSYYTETYYVLKSNKNIKHGHYQKYNSKNELMENGYYKLDKKDSLWTEYSYNGALIKSRGSYSADLKNGLWETFYHNSSSLRNKGSFTNDKKSGIWEFFNDVSELVQKYDFDKRELLFDGVQNDTQLEMEVLTESGYVKKEVEKSPAYIGGENELRTHLVHTIRYPEIALDNGIQGTVLVSFIVNEKGLASDFKAENLLGGGLDRESIRVLQLTADNWMPAIYNGAPVTVKMAMPVKFKLSR